MKFYHNPRCSKSRAVQSLLEDCEEVYETIEYQKHPFTRADLVSILAKLQMKPADLIRKGDAKKAGLDVSKMTNDQIITTMAANPALVERPIVVKGSKAAVGRPPEDVLKIL